jgi:hypothetical protein
LAHYLVVGSSEPPALGNESPPDGARSIAMDERFQVTRQS